MPTRLPILLFSIFIIIVSVLQAQDYKLKAVKIDGYISIDGKLDEEFWKNAEKVELNYEIQITDNSLALQKTIAMALYNKDSLYFGFICYDSNPKAIRAHVTDRDKIWEDDFVILMLDTYGDNQNAYEIAVNPYGIQGDRMRSGNFEDMRFDFVWHSAGLVSDSGWSVEIAIPFKSIRFPKKQNQGWNIIIGRNYPRESRYIFSWTPVDKNNPCLMCQAGKLIGLEEISSGSFFELLPYAMSYQTGYLQDDDPNQFKNDRIKARAGIGVKFSPSSETIIEGVLNPDFSQVETDEYQIRVNTTFALYYPEKRPFFLEGMEGFQTPINVFYSRMLNSPLFALKLKQKTDEFLLTYISSLDQKTPFLIPGEERSSTVLTSLKSFANSGRLRYDFGNQSFVGLLFTSRNLSGAYNYVAGIDWNYFFWKSYYFRGQILYSIVKEVNDTTTFKSNRRFGNTNYTATFDGERYSGLGAVVRFMKFAKYHEFEITYRDFSPTFQPQLGFVTRNNVRFINIENRFNFYPRGSVVDIWDLFMEFGLQFNYAGARKERWGMVGVRAQLKAQTQLFIGFLPINEEIFASRRFTGIHRIFGNIYSTPFKFLSFNVRGEYGKQIYRNPNDPKLGFAKDFSVNLRLKPSEKIEISGWYSKAHLENAKTKELFYDGYVSGIVGIYQFNPNLFIRLIAQYDSFDGSIQVFPLLSFKLNPFTMFYIGSTVNMHDFGEGYGIRQRNREIFLKVQYLWRN
jgi:hypothetical protein